MEGKFSIISARFGAKLEIDRARKIGILVCFSKPPNAWMTRAAQASAWWRLAIFLGIGLESISASPAKAGKARVKGQDQHGQEFFRKFWCDIHHRRLLIHK